MSAWTAIGLVPDALYDETVAVEKLTGTVWGAVEGLEALRCTFEPITGNNAVMVLALHDGATHIVHLRGYQPQIARGWRVRKGTSYYVVNDVEHHDEAFTDLQVQSTTVKG